MVELSLSLTRWTGDGAGYGEKGPGGDRGDGEGREVGLKGVGSYQLFDRNGQKLEENDRYKYILESLLDIRLIDCVGV